MKTKLIISLALLVSLTACCAHVDRAIKKTDQFIKSEKIDKNASDWKINLQQPPQLTFSQSKRYFWQLETNQGEIKIVLFPDVAPMHVSSTIYLTRLGFYDDVHFHRVIPGFMAQGGDPLGNGRGGPGYKYAGEFDKMKSTDINATHHKKGMLSMANAGPNTDGSQFFITFKATPFLDGKHTIFGEVVSGLDDTLVNMEKLGSRRGKPAEPIKIIKARIIVEDKDT